MDRPHLEKQILEIKDKVIENVDKHFNNYIIEDLKSIDKDDYFLIDSVSWSIYWTDMLAELKPIMDYILSGLAIYAETDSYEEMLKECVNMKRVIDANIIKYEIAIKKEDEIDMYDILREAGIQIPKPKYPEPIQFSETEGRIKALHSGLKSEWGYIEVSYEEFISHSKKSEKGYSKIHWKADGQDLALLILLLQRHNFIANIYARRINQVQLIMTHFYNKDKESFKNASVRSLLRRMESNMDSMFYRNFSSFIAAL